jgi:cytochrome P450
MYPAVAANYRQAVVDTILPVGGGPDGAQPIFIEKGTHVIFHPWSMHRREDIFGPNPETFNPNRWDGLRPGWGFLPFNGGPRICLGRKSLHLPFTSLEAGS